MEKGTPGGSSRSPDKSFVSGYLSSDDEGKASTRLKLYTYHNESGELMEPPLLLGKENPGVSVTITDLNKDDEEGTDDEGSDEGGVENLSGSVRITYRNKDGTLDDLRQPGISSPGTQADGGSEGGNGPAPTSWKEGLDKLHRDIDKFVKEGFANSSVLNNEGSDEDDSEREDPSSSGSDDEDSSSSDSSSSDSDDEDSSSSDEGEEDELRDSVIINFRNEDETPDDLSKSGISSPGVQADGGSEGGNDSASTPWQTDLDKLHRDIDGLENDYGNVFPDSHSLSTGDKENPDEGKNDGSSSSNLRSASVWAKRVGMVAGSGVAAGLTHVTLGYFLQERALAKLEKWWPSLKERALEEKKKPFWTSKKVWEVGRGFVDGVVFGGVYFILNHYLSPKAATS
jgi:hypothetical protein